MKKILDFSNQALQSLNKGAFLVCNTVGGTNAMTIGWGNVGIMWNKPVIVVPVRYSRLTHDLMEEGDDFTVCFPKVGELKKEIAYCGTKSGRDYSKIEVLGLTAGKAKSVEVSIIEECKLIFECRTLAKMQMEDASFLDKNMLNINYPDKNFHTLYYGEILEAYER